MAWLEGASFVPKHSTKKDREYAPSFMQIQKWELNSNACLALTGDEFKIYSYMRSIYNGKNNGRISMSARDAAGIIGKSPATASRCLHILVAVSYTHLTLPTILLV